MEDQQLYASNLILVLTWLESHRDDVDNELKIAEKDVREINKGIKECSRLEENVEENVWYGFQYGKKRHYEKLLWNRLSEQMELEREREIFVEIIDKVEMLKNLN